MNESLIDYSPKKDSFIQSQSQVFALLKYSASVKEEVKGYREKTGETKTPPPSPNPTLPLVKVWLTINDAITSCFSPHPEEI